MGPLCLLLALGALAWKLEVWIQIPALLLRFPKWSEEGDSSSPAGLSQGPMGERCAKAWLILPPLTCSLTDPSG